MISFPDTNNLATERTSNMVYRIDNWFIFEPGDVVLILPFGAKGIVTENVKEDFDPKSKTQTVWVQNRRGKQKKYGSNRLELVKGYRRPELSKNKTLSR